MGWLQQPWFQKPSYYHCRGFLWTLLIWTSDATPWSKRYQAPTFLFDTELLVLEPQWFCHMFVHKNRHLLWRMCLHVDPCNFCATNKHVHVCVYWSWLLSQLCTCKPRNQMSAKAEHPWEPCNHMHNTYHQTQALSVLLKQQSHISLELFLCTLRQGPGTRTIMHFIQHAYRREFFSIYTRLWSLEEVTPSNVRKTEG